MQKVSWTIFVKWRQISMPNYFAFFYVSWLFTTWYTNPTVAVFTPGTSPYPLSKYLWCVHSVRSRARCYSNTHNTCTHIYTHTQFKTPTLPCKQSRLKIVKKKTDLIKSRKELDLEMEFHGSRKANILYLPNMRWLRRPWGAVGTTGRLAADVRCCDMLDSKIAVFPTENGGALHTPCYLSDASILF